MNIQIRNVPEPLHRELKVRAAKRGLSLSSYLLEQLSELASHPTLDEWLARTERPRSRVSDFGTRDAADAVREERENR